MGYLDILTVNKIVSWHMPVSYFENIGWKSFKGFRAAQHCDSFGHF